MTREIASGRDAHWPGLEQALADVRSGRRAALVAYSPEQLMRDWAHFAAIRDECEHAGVHSVSVQADV